MTAITLRQVTAENMWAVCDLAVSEAQNSFVAPNAVSLAQARFNDHAWYRAIYADEIPVGFMMLYDNPYTHEYFLWRLMIDQRYQGKGYAHHAMLQLFDRIKSRPGATVLGTSCVPGPDGPESFYLGLGFAPTGGREGSEIDLELRWHEARTTPEPRVTLKAIDGDNVRDICRLKVADCQRKDIVDNPRSLAESLFYGHLRSRGIYLAEEAIGFMMWEDDPQKGAYFLWRLMIDQRFQGKGYGREALEQLIEIIRKRPGAREFKTSFIPGFAGPENFYRSLGFLPTEEYIDDERVFSLQL